MAQVLDVFLNGIAGVFAGMGVLYLTLKLLAMLPGGRRKEDQQQ